ncbi:hypothetical protein K504DRAFT_445516 [Pleomassaria siparia CBS 279.74]|uniref:Uncharacterized protein n=1 Tax=Pleomassaria siparia CBS 279.74 TaxID=1314801 RepID=A0A6G1KQ66_9PLEO|nr:hypothetical protein K504DRAFT_445516 [Pleomassaria siparia CBS 279.74]
MEKAFLLSASDKSKMNESGFSTPDSRLEVKTMGFGKWTLAYAGTMHVVIVLALVAAQHYRHKIPFLKTPEEVWRLLSVGTVISHEHSTDHDKYSILSGPPTCENTLTWEDIIQLHASTFFSASQDESFNLKENITGSVKLADSDGCLSGLGVYHELYCSMLKLTFSPHRTTFWFPCIRTALEFYNHFGKIVGRIGKEEHWYI